MKFTELHIAVVTFHPCKIYFPLSRSFCRMHFSRVTRGKVGRREKRGKGNRMRENMIDGENGRIHEEKKKNRKKTIKGCVGSKKER